jgi:hypothetical protein
MVLGENIMEAGTLGLAMAVQVAVAMRNWFGDL